MGASPLTAEPSPRRALGHMGILFAASILFGAIVSLVVGSRLEAQVGLLLSLAAQQIGVTGGLLLWFVRASGQSPRDLLGRSDSVARWAAAALALAPALVVLESPLLDAWAGAIDASEPAWYAVALDAREPLRGVLVVAVVAVVAPVCEEAAFRGYLLPQLRPYGDGIANLAQASLFTVYHVDPFGVPAYFLTGLALGWIRLRTGVLWPAIAVHAVINGLGVLDWNLGRTGLSAPTAPWVASAAVLFAVAAALLRPAGPRAP